MMLTHDEQEALVASLKKVLPDGWGFILMLSPFADAPGAHENDMHILSNVAQGEVAPAIRLVADKMEQIRN